MSTSIIGRNAFLTGLSSEDFHLLRPHLTPKELAAGALLQSYGERIGEVIFPNSGVVALSIGMRNGLGVCTGVIGCDGFIGGFASSAPATCDCQVVVAGLGSRMSASAFRYALEQSPSLRRRAAQFDAVLVARAQCTAACNAAHSVENRLSRCLLDMQDRTGSDCIPLTQEMVGQMLGVRRTTVTLVAGELERAGVLNGRRGAMEIVDRAGLEQSACECYHRLKSYALALESDQDGPLSAAQHRPKG